MGLTRGRRWLRRHVRIVVDPGEQYVAVVTPGTTAPPLAIAVRRHPAAARVTVEEIE